MSNIPIKRIRYEFDKSAKSPNNLVANEGHTLNSRQKRVFMPVHAHFYTKSFSMIDKATGRKVPESAYFFDDVSEVIALKTGHAAASIVVVTDRSVSSNISISYQVVGGEFTGADVKKLAERVAELNIDNRPVEWANIANKPSTYNPANHMHSLWQTYDYGELIYVVERLVQATLLGDEASHDVIWDAINNAKNVIDNDFQTLRDNVNAFINKSYVETPTLNNYYTKVQVDAKDKAINDRAVAHINAKGNPHDLKLSDLGGASVSYVDGELSKIQTTIGSLSSTYATKAEHNAYRTTNDRAVGANKTAIDTINRNFPNTYETKANVAAQKTKTHDYVSSQDVFMSKVLQKMMFGTFTAPTAQLTNSNGTKYTLTEKMVTDFISTNLSGKHKLVESIIPISTADFNGLRWNKDGLYYGTAPDGATGVLYVDPTLGVDEPVTYNNGRGTRAKPLATIGYALTQGPGGVNRTIYLAEGKRHKVGQQYNSALDGSGMPVPLRLPNNQKGTFGRFRGGQVVFYPFGPEYDKLLAANAGDNIDATTEQIDTYKKMSIVPVVETVGFWHSSKDLGQPYITFEAFFFDAPTSLSFNGMKIRYGYSAAENNLVSQMCTQRAGRKTFQVWSIELIRGNKSGAFIGFNGCTFDLGGVVPNFPGYKSPLILSYSDYTCTFTFWNSVFRTGMGVNALIDCQNAGTVGIRNNVRQPDTAIPQKAFATVWTENQNIWFYNVKFTTGGTISGVNTNVQSGIAQYLNTPYPWHPRRFPCVMEFNPDTNQLFAIYMDPGNRDAYQWKQIYPHILPITYSNGGPPGDISGLSEGHIWLQGG